VLFYLQGFQQIAALENCCGSFAFFLKLLNNLHCHVFAGILQTLARQVAHKKIILSMIVKMRLPCFCRWLQQLCDEEGKYLHLDVHNLGGGAPLKMLQEALERRRRGLERGDYIASVLLLDGDCLEEGHPRTLQTWQLAQRESFRLIVQKPNQELAVRAFLGGFGLQKLQILIQTRTQTQQA
jgi:hypothetical protein